MRVRFEWTVDTALELPVSYHKILQGIIYQNMRNEYGYSTFVHEEGYQYGARQYRMFCFSHIMGKSHYCNGRLFFVGALAFEVSSPDVYLIRTLAENVEQKGLYFKEQHYPDIEIYFSDCEIETQEMIVRTLSPITVYTTLENGKTYYYAPMEAEFSAAIHDNFQRKYLAYSGVPARSLIVVEPLQLTAKDKCVTRYQGIYITAYNGIYKIRGERKYLNFLYQTGLGSKNSQGFGMVELVEGI